MAVYMPMSVESVVGYLGTILAGCAAVTIADSFAPREIATRLRIARCRAVFTQVAALAVRHVLAAWVSGCYETAMQCGSSM